METKLGFAKTHARLQNTYRHFGPVTATLALIVQTELDLYVRMRLFSIK